MLQLDLSEIILKNIHRIAEGKMSARLSKSKKNLPQYLGASLVMTQIVYEALDAIPFLPLPMFKSEPIPYLNRTKATSVQER